MNPRFTIAFDEAQELCDKCKTFHFISDLSNQTNSNNLVKSSLLNDSLDNRHLCYALTKYLTSITINALFSGTSFLLQ